MEKKISYLNRNYDDYRKALIEFTKTYYPDLMNSFDDASIGSWFIDINAAIADELSYHIDRVFQETNINSANKETSIYALARNNGVKIPGPKAAMCEVKFSCNLPLAKSSGIDREPDWSYAPVLKRGTKVSSSNQTFELLEDVDFANPFNNEGISDRTFVPIKNSNGVTTAYRVTKLAIVVGGETKIYKKTVMASDITPFMEVLIPVEGTMNVESVIVKTGSAFQENPTLNEFYMKEEKLDKFPNTTRFFEVDSLVQQERWGEKTKEGQAETYWYTADDKVPVCAITKGEWKPVRHKFITEFTDNGYLKVIFGAGMENVDNISLDGASSFSKYQITKTLFNDSLGVLPNVGTTIFILYRSGGGKSNNVAKGAINQISYLNVEIGNRSEGDGNDVQIISSVKNSLKVENTIPSVSGKDMPTVDELRYIIKYNNGGQDRCVTVKDYVSRVLLLPPKYGTPFRVAGVEMNNKIVLYLLGIDYEGHLQSIIPSLLVSNIKNYLVNYRSVNDFVEIKPGKIINLGFDVELFIDKEYNKSDVITNVINVIKKYFDINKLQMGDDIFVGDIEKEISKIDGVLSLIKLRAYHLHNEFSGRNYSNSETIQQTVAYDEDEYIQGRDEIDLEASDRLLIADGDSMFEIKYPEYDITCRCKER